MKRRLSVTNFSSENNLVAFRLNAPVVIRAKVRRCEQTLLIYSHALLRIQVATGHWLDCCAEEARREEQSSTTFDLQ